MDRTTRILFKVLVLVFVIGGFVILLPSVIGFLLIILLVFAVFDFLGRRRRNNVQTLNSALRAVCHHPGGIAKVALAFSRQGPLSGPCYEYARRLMIGEDPIEAAVMARVPLQLQTAIAMQSPEQTSSSDKVSQQHEAAQLAMVDSNTIPAYGQFVYLTATALVTCIMLGFMSVFIVPTIDVMFDEFYETELPRRSWLTTTPSLAILGVLAVTAVVVVPLLNRGHLLGIRLPRWIPKTPRLAERRSEILCGLADAIDAGWPLGRAMAVGHSIAAGSFERRAFEDAMRLIQSGADPIEAMRRAGWIDSTEASWLTGATPERTAGLLRTIGDQQVRDARSNLRWMMAIFFPALILSLGVAVMAFAAGFFGALTELIRGIA